MPMKPQTAPVDTWTPEQRDAQRQYEDGLQANPGQVREYDDDGRYLGDPEPEAAQEEQEYQPMAPGM